MNQPLHVLIVEDSEDDTLILLRALNEGGFAIDHLRVETEETMRAALQDRVWDAILFDYRLPEFDALRAITIVHESGLDLPCILVSGAIGEETAVAAMRTGFHDYIFKNNMSRLSPALFRELGEAKVRQERHQAREDLKRASRDLEQRVAARTEELHRALLDLQSEMAERMRVSESLLHAQEWLALAQRAGRIGMFEWNLVTNRVHWTPELEYLFGLVLGSFEGTFAGWMSRVHPDDVDRVRLEIEDWLRSDRPGLYCKYRYEHMNGETHWLETRAQVTRAGDGTALRVVGACVDVTNLKETEDALRASEDKYRILANASPALIWSALPDGRADFVNARWREFTGLSEDHLNRLGWGAVCHPDDLMNFSTDWRARAARGELFDAENRYRRVDGEYRWFMSRVAPINLPDGSVARWLGVAIDITERMQAEEILRQSQRTLEERVQERTAALTVANAQLQEEINERAHAEAELKKVALALDEERIELKNKNIALQELLEAVGSQRSKLQTEVIANLEGTVQPILQLLKAAHPAMVPTLLSQLESSLDDLMSPMTTTLRGPLTRLSPREVQICNYIRNGMSSKEIADVLGIAPRTVLKTREVIRKKLGLTHQDDNLAEYLTKLSEIK